MRAAVAAHGRKAWTDVARDVSAAFPGRPKTSKQCRARWVSSLDPKITTRPWTADEERVIHEAQAEVGNKWATIAKRCRAPRPPRRRAPGGVFKGDPRPAPRARAPRAHRQNRRLPGRTDNAVKNYWRGAGAPSTRASSSGAPGSGSPLPGGSGARARRSMPTGTPVPGASEHVAAPRRGGASARRRRAAGRRGARAGGGTTRPPPSPPPPAQVLPEAQDRARQEGGARAAPRRAARGAAPRGRARPRLRPGAGSWRSCV